MRTCPYCGLDFCDNPELCVAEMELAMEEMDDFLCEELETFQLEDIYHTPFEYVNALDESERFPI